MCLATVYQQHNGLGMQIVFSSLLLLNETRLAETTHYYQLVGAQVLPQLSSIVVAEVQDVFFLICIAIPTCLMLYVHSFNISDIRSPSNSDNMPMIIAIAKNGFDTPKPIIAIVAANKDTPNILALHA